MSNSARKIDKSSKGFIEFKGGMYSESRRAGARVNAKRASKVSIGGFFD